MREGVVSYQMHLCEAAFLLPSHKLLYPLLNLSLLLFILSDVGQRPEVLRSCLASTGRCGLRFRGEIPAYRHIDE